MQKWTRWQDWVALLRAPTRRWRRSGPRRTTSATWTMVVLGVVTVAVSLWSLATPEDRISEYALVLLGVLFIVSPWVMGFDDLDSMALTAWIVGAVTRDRRRAGHCPRSTSRMHRTRSRTSSPATSRPTGRPRPCPGPCPFPSLIHRPSREHPCRRRPPHPHPRRRRGALRRRRVRRDPDRADRRGGRGAQGAGLLLLPAQDRPAADPAAGAAAGAVPRRPSTASYAVATRPLAARAAPPARPGPPRLAGAAHDHLPRERHSPRGPRPPAPAAPCARSSSPRPPSIRPSSGPLARALRRQAADTFVSVMLDHANARRAGGALPDVKGAAAVVALAVGAPGSG